MPSDASAQSYLEGCELFMAGSVAYFWLAVFAAYEVMEDAEDEALFYKGKVVPSIKHYEIPEKRKWKVRNVMMGDHEDPRRRR